jgi:Glycosyltransferase family 87
MGVLWVGFKRLRDEKYRISAQFLMSEIARWRTLFLAIALLWMAVVNGCVLWNTRIEIVEGYGDFASFYTAGTLANRGLGSEIYNPRMQWKVQQEFAAGDKLRLGPLPFIRPPFEALLFAPFARLPYVTALIVWSCLNLIVLAVTPYVVVDRAHWNGSFPLWAVGLLVLGTFPAFMNFLMGQDALLVVLLYAIAFRQLARHRDLSAGIVLGLALFKFNLVIPVVIASAIAGRKQVLRGFAASGAAVVAASAMVVGWRGLLSYPGYLLNLNRQEGVGMVYSEVQTNFRGLLSLFVGRASYPGPIHWLLAPLALGIVGYAGFLWRKAGDRFLAEGFGVSTIAAIVTSYYSREYDFLLLIVPLVAMWTRPAAESAMTNRAGRYLEEVGLILLLLMPVYWFVKIRLGAACLMALPVIAVGVAWARRLRFAEVVAQPRAPLPVGPG